MTSETMLFSLMTVPQPVQTFTPPSSTICGAGHPGFGQLDVLGCVVGRGGCGRPIAVGRLIGVELGGFRLASRPTGGRGPRGGIGRAPDLGADILIEAKSKRFQRLNLDRGTRWRPSPHSLGNFLNGRRAAIFFFCSERFIDCHENRDKDESGSEREKYSTCLCNSPESAELGSNQRHSSGVDWMLAIES